MNQQQSDKTWRGQYSASNLKVLPMARIVLPNYQPRQYFDEGKLDELARTIVQQGVLSPLLVRSIDSDRYELVAGGRRFRAAQKAGLTEVPTIVLNLADEEVLEVALLENLQREGLNLLEETEGILALVALRLGIAAEEVPRLLQRLAKQQTRQTLSGNVTGQNTLETIEAVFNSLGNNAWQSFVRNRLPLLKLPPPLLEALRQNRIAYTKALAIAKVRDRIQQVALLETAIAQKLSLSQIRDRVRELNQVARPSQSPDRLKERFNRIQTQLARSKVWESEGKRQELELLLARIESLVVD